MAGTPAPPFYPPQKSARDTYPPTPSPRDGGPGGGGPLPPIPGGGPGITPWGFDPTLAPPRPSTTNSGGIFMPNGGGTVQPRIPGLPTPAVRNRPDWQTQRPPTPAYVPRAATSDSKARAAAAGEALRLRKAGGGNPQMGYGPQPYPGGGGTVRTAIGGPYPIGPDGRPQLPQFPGYGQPPRMGYGDNEQYRPPPPGQPTRQAPPQMGYGPQPYPGEDFKGAGGRNPYYQGMPPQASPQAFPGGAPPQQMPPTQGPTPQPRPPRNRPGQGGGMTSQPVGSPQPGDPAVSGSSGVFGPRMSGADMINQVNNQYGVDATGWYDEAGNLTDQGRQGWDAYNQSQGGGQGAVGQWLPHNASPFYGGAGFNFNPYEQ